MPWPHFRLRSIIHSNHTHLLSNPLLFNPMGVATHLADRAAKATMDAATAVDTVDVPTIFAIATHLSTAGHMEAVGISARIASPNSLVIKIWLPLRTKWVVTPIIARPPDVVGLKYQM